MKQSQFNLPTNNRYGITEKKKVELDALALQVLTAQYDVEQQQAIVNSLTQKNLKFQDILNNTENSRTLAQTNKQLAEKLEESVIDLITASKITVGEIKKAQNNTSELTKAIKPLTDKLIYSAQVLNKLAANYIRMKALNPLISDELISRLTSAGSDANSAVALTLVALQKSFAAEASNYESEEALRLAHTQTLKLHNVIPDEKTGHTSITSLFDQAYNNLSHHHRSQHIAFTAITGQLNHAQVSLNNAQIKLKSLQTGLAAANAAGLAG